MNMRERENHNSCNIGLLMSATLSRANTNRRAW